MGLFVGQKWCISGNPGNMLLGHHLSVESPLVCSQGMLFQVEWSGMLGLGRGGQRQLRFSKAMDSISLPAHIISEILGPKLQFKMQERALDGRHTF